MIIICVCACVLHWQIKLIPLNSKYNFHKKLKIKKLLSYYDKQIHRVLLYKHQFRRFLL